LRHVFYAAVATTVLGLIVFSAVYVYVSSERFSTRVQNAVVSTLEKATGGRVEIKKFHWSVIHLNIAVDGLTIHGLEAADQIPYLHVDHLEIDAKILSFFRPKIGLSRILINHPVFHLIVYPDGTTNQPHPKTQSQTSSLPQILFDLAVDDTHVNNGLILINDHVIPWELSAEKLGLLIQYVATTGHYQASLSVQDFTFRLQKDLQSRSAFTADIDITKQAANITHMEWSTASSKLTVTGSLANYAHPVWNANAKGQVDLHEVGAVTGYSPLSNGIAQVDLRAAGKADGEFALDGNVSVREGGFTAPWLLLRHVTLQTQVHLDNTTMLFTQVKSVLDGRGRVDGTLKLTNWMYGPPPIPQPAPKKKHWFGAKKTRTKKAPVVAYKSQQLQASLEATVADLPSPLVLAAVAPRRFDDIGFSAEVTGPVHAFWHGPGEALDVHGDLTFRPELRVRRGSIPVSGFVKADYLGDYEHLVFQQADLTTPGTEVHATGTLSLIPEDLDSAMSGTVTVQHLREFDRLLYVLADTSPKSSAKDIGASSAIVAGGLSTSRMLNLPIHLLGNATFQGKFSGALLEPQLNGHIVAHRFTTELPHFDANHTEPAASPPTHALEWDSLQADVSYVPSEIQARHVVMARGETILHANAQLRPVLISKGEYAYNAQNSLIADAHITDASIPDLLAITGSTFPAAGKVSANAQVHGTLENLTGTGAIIITGLNIANQPIALAACKLSAFGHTVEASDIRVRSAGGSASGFVAYDYLSHAMEGSITGQQFDLAQIRSLQATRASVGGTGSIHVQVTGTLMTPVATSSLILDNVMLNGQPMGQVRAEANLHGKTLLLTSRAQLLDTHFEAGGQIQLTPGLPAQLKLQFTDFNIDPVLQMFTHSGITGKSAIRGQVQLSGPLQQLRRLQAEANLDRFSVTVNDIPLETDGPVQFSVRNGLVELLPVHIKGKNTDLKVQGTANLLGDQRIRGHAEGGINAALAKTFNDDLSASGHVDFSVNARGTLHNPRLAGNVHVDNLEISVMNLTNGLSAMNGTLIFDNDRLVIQQLSGYTGGGKVDFTGYINFRNGLYLDVAANAKEIRIRYPRGVTSTVGLNLHLDGAPDALLLRGKVQLTRFAISKNTDLAALAAASQSISAPPDPTSILNQIRLDVQVTSSQQLGFQNSFATLAGDVNLHVRGTLASPSLLGRIDVSEGKATFAGTQYILQRGDIVFTNPVTIDPEVNLEATARVRNYDIIIGVNGPSSKLQINYRSEPPLSQADVLALLTLGRTNEEATRYGEQQQVGGNPTTEALLGGALNAAVSTRVQQLFGVASVRVDPNFVGVLGQSTARVTVEQQVGRDLTLVFATNVNTTAQQLLQAQYNITRNLSIIAVRDEADVFSLYFQIRGKRH
jgi:translocation and assembly module TamB